MSAQAKPLGWFGIVRLGMVQFAIGAIVMLATSLLNRLMVVEYALAAAVPAGLVAWHYAVQLSRPLWGHGSDRGRRRTPWIVAGMAMLAGGVMLAVSALEGLGQGSLAGYVTAIIAFAIIGAGVGAAGTSLLALLATQVAPTYMFATSEGQVWARDWHNEALLAGRLGDQSRGRCRLESDRGGGGGRAH